MRIVSGLILCGLAMTAVASERCERTPLDDYVERGRDLLIGELHGTAEGLALIRCLVLTALARKGGEPLVVSLEHTSAARDLADMDWKSPDGRSSIAMWELARFLLDQEKRPRLHLSAAAIDGFGPEIPLTRDARRAGIADPSRMSSTAPPRVFFRAFSSL